MSRDWWTVYDDDSMEYNEYEVEYSIDDFELIDLGELIRLAALGISNEKKDKDHFEQEDDLFEM